MSATVIARASSRVRMRARPGIVGPPSRLKIGTVDTSAPGSAASATISGVAPDQTLNLVIPTGPAGSLAAGNATALPAGAAPTINFRGANPQYLDVGLPVGGTGPAGPATALAIGTVAGGASAGATITGTAPNQTLNLTLPKGDPGTASALAIGTVTSGPAAATITGSAPTQTLNLTLPAGPPGPANSLAIGTVAAGAAAASITGAAPSQTLNLTLPPGAPCNVSMGTITTLAPGAAATATLTGTAPNYTLNLGLPQGSQGSAGSGSGTVTHTGTPTNGQLATFSGTSGDLIGGVTALPAANFPALTGDITTAGGALTTTLATTTVAAGSYGDATHVPLFTVDAKGRLTAASSTNIAFPVTSVAGLTGGVAAAALKSALAIAVADIVDATANGRSLISAANYAAMLTLLGGQAALGFTPENAANKNQANGYAGLDSTGKVATAQLPASVLGDLQYQGGWNASTNSPAIPAASTANKGWYYVVTTAGTTAITGAVDNDWQVGDWLVSNGSTGWDKVDNADLVKSVAGLTGAIPASGLKSALAIAAADITDASTAGKALLIAANAGAQLTALGVSTFIKALLDDADGPTALATLGAQAALTFASAATAAGGTDNVQPVTSKTLADLAAPLTVAYASTLALDLATRKDFEITLSGNLTLANFVNAKPGDRGRIGLTENSTGGYTLAVGSYFYLLGGGSMDTGANKRTVLSYDVVSSTRTDYTLLKA